MYQFHSFSSDRAGILHFIFLFDLNVFRLKGIKLEWK